MELIHLRRRGVTDEEHASFLIGYIPHDQVLKGKYWGLVLDHTGEKCHKKTKEREDVSHFTVVTISLLIHWFLHFILLVSEYFVYHTWKDVSLVFLLQKHQDVCHQ